MRFVFILIVFFGVIKANTVEEIFFNANIFMKNNDYNNAVSLYESALELNQEHADIYYNLGNAYYRLGFLGNAIWAYSKAIKLKPRDKDIQYNLLLTKSQTIDRVELPDDFLILTKYREFKSMLTLEEYSFLSSIFLLILILFNFFIKLVNIKLKIMDMILNMLIIATLGIHGITLEKYLTKKTENKAVFIINSVKAFSAPSQNSGKNLFNINEGSICDILINQESWSKISLIDGKVGWVKNIDYRSLK